MKMFANEHSFICVYELSTLFCCTTEISSANNIDFSSNQLANVYCFFFTYDKLVRLSSYQMLGGGISEYFWQNRAV